MGNVRQVAKNVFLIDDHLYSVKGLGSVYLLLEDKVALIDSGPATSAELVLEGIREIGLRLEQVEYIIITHIHLDHAGGVGLLLKNMPTARVVLHPRAVRHLVDPAALIKSVIEAQGCKAMLRNGDVLAVEESRTWPVHDLDTLELSKEQVLTFLETPGHAPHHLCIFESRNGGIFVGDAVGHAVEDTDIMVPITPPPSFDLELYLQSLDRLGRLKASRIYFSHSGVSDQVGDKLRTASHKLRERQAVLDQASKENNLENAADRLITHICGELAPLKRDMPSVFAYWAEVDIPMSAAEHVRYYRKTHG